MKYKFILTLLLLGATLTATAQMPEGFQMPQMPQLPPLTAQIQTESYAIKGQDTLLIDFYVDPALTAPAEGLPTLIYIHGGGFYTGSRVNGAQEVFCRYVASQGFLVASVDYRLAGIITSPDQPNPYGVTSVYQSVRMACEDVVNATRYVLQHAPLAVNPALVSLAGGSAGAITALTLVYDLLCEADYTKALPADFAYAGVISQAGGVATLGDSLQWAKRPCPIMFFHGTRDEMVTREEIAMGETHLMGTEYICRQLDTLGVPYWNWVEQDADHIIAMKTCTSYLDEQVRFLRQWATGLVNSTVHTTWHDPVPASMGSVGEMIRFAPLYILGYEKYLNQIDWQNLGGPKQVVY